MILEAQLYIVYKGGLAHLPITCITPKISQNYGLIFGGKMGKAYPNCIVQVWFELSSMELAFWSRWPVIILILCCMASLRLVSDLIKRDSPSRSWTAGCCGTYTWAPKWPQTSRRDAVQATFPSTRFRAIHEFILTWDPSLKPCSGSHLEPRALDIKLCHTKPDAILPRQSQQSHRGKTCWDYRSLASACGSCWISGANGTCGSWKKTSQEFRCTCEVFSNTFPKCL